MQNLIETFFPILEQIMASDAFTGSPNYIPMMVLIAKIFYMSIQVSIALKSLILT